MQPAPLRIAFFGLPLAALLLARDGHTVVYAGLCRPHSLGTRRLLRSLEPHKVVLRPSVDTHETLEHVRAARPDLLVSWFWTTRFPPALLAIPPQGSLGVHPSLLPRHRGPDPCFWAIDTGDSVTGVTVHRLESEYDTGDILAQEELPIDPTWNAWNLARALDRPSLRLLRSTVRRIAHGEPLRALHQQEEHATYAPELDLDALAIRWNVGTEQIVRRVRAAAPWPGATTWLGDELVTLLEVRPADRYPEALLPGEAALHTEHGKEVALVRTGDSAVTLHAGRRELPEGGTHPLDPAAFVDWVRRTGNGHARIIL